MKNNNKEYKNIEPKFIKENKLKQLEKLINLKCGEKDNMIKQVLVRHFKINISTSSNPNPDQLFKFYHDLLLITIDNNEHRQVWIDEYRES